MSARPRVSLVTLGCARNDADSEELAGRLRAGGFTVVTEPADADAVVVNTCGFIAAAKKDSVDTLLAAADGAAPVVAVGCLAERYGSQLAAALPEAAAVLGFDDYPEIDQRLREVLAGHRPAPPEPRDRRVLLPLAPAERPAPPRAHPVVRHRLDAAVCAPVKLASGCDRRCAFCAIPRFRGAFVSRDPAEVLAEAEWLAARGVREIHLVSENSTSYGKDLGSLRALEELLPALAALPGVARVRVAYLQPAEVRPGLVEVIATTPGVAAYFDLSFQHASAAVLRRMRRFGDRQRFGALLEKVRSLAPGAGVRSNVIVGFPGETRADVAELERFLVEAGLDAVGVFPYSDEEGTEAAGLPGKVPSATVRRRWQRVSSLVEELTAQRAADRVGSLVEVLVETVAGGPDGADPPALPTRSPGPDPGGEPGAEGRAAHQGPDSDGSCRLPPGPWRPGDLVVGRVTGSEGVDLVVEPVAGPLR